MKKQILRTLTASAVFAALALFASVGAARAQSTSGVRAQVPFDFYVGDRLLPAGEYTFRRAGGAASDMLLVVGETDKAVRQTSAVEGGGAAGATRLVFHRYADQYFLARLWTAGAEAGREFRPSKRERAIKAEGAQVAARGGNAESMKAVVVEIAAAR